MADAVLDHLPHDPRELVLPELPPLVSILEGHLIEPVNVKLEKGKHQATLLHLTLSLALHDLWVDEGEIVLWTVVILSCESLSSQGLDSGDVRVDDKHAVDGLHLVGRQVGDVVTGCCLLHLL